MAQKAHDGGSPKRSNRKNGIKKEDAYVLCLAIERILLEYSDEEHPLHIGSVKNNGEGPSGLKKHLEDEFNITCDSDTIRQALEFLGKFYTGEGNPEDDSDWKVKTFEELDDGTHLHMGNALEIGKKRGRTGWELKIAGRRFERHEVEFLLDLCRYSNVGDEETVNAIEFKLLSLLTEEARREEMSLTDDGTVDESSKERKLLGNVLLNYQVIRDAISNKKKLSFFYSPALTGNVEAGGYKCNNIIPYFVRVKDGCGFMFGKRPRHSGFTVYRLDRIRDIRKIDTDPSNEWPGTGETGRDYYAEGQRTAQELFSFGIGHRFPTAKSDIAEIEVTCLDELSAERLEKRFGHIRGFRSHFWSNEPFQKTFWFRAYKAGFLEWSLKYLSAIRIEQPADMRDKAMEILSNSAYGERTQELPESTTGD